MSFCSVKKYKDNFFVEDHSHLGNSFFGLIIWSKQSNAPDVKSTPLT